MVLEQTTEGCNFIKKETLAQVFPCKFCEISKNNFFTEHLWAIASEHKNWTTTFQKVHLLVLTFVLQEQLPEVFYEKMFHSANVSSATNAIRWRFFFFFQSQSEANEMFCLLNKFVLFTNQNQPLNVFDKIVV